MEIVDVSLTEFTRRSGVVRVGHRESELPRALEVGDEVLVLADGEFHDSVVVEVDQTDADPAYVIRMGRQVPLLQALDRIAGLPVRELPEVPEPAAQRLQVARG